MIGKMGLVDTVRLLALTLVPLILSFTVHEFAHAWSAHKLGDDTAKEEGRLTLNPLSHIDPLGTLLMPAMGVLMGGLGFFGWARPTPVRIDRMRPGINRRLGDILISAAGPLSNLLMATITIAVFGLLIRFHVPLVRADIEEVQSIDDLTPMGSLLWEMFYLNVGLTVLNLWPIPPFDGHHLLPPLFDPILVPLRRYGFVIVIVLFMMEDSFPPAKLVVNIMLRWPVGWLSAHLRHLFLP